MHTATNAAGITNTYTHQGNVNDLFSFVKISNKFFMILSFLVRRTPICVNGFMLSCYPSTFSGCQPLIVVPLCCLLLTCERIRHPLHVKERAYYLLVSPFACAFPCTLRKVRDLNPRAISDSRVSSAVLSASQPTFHVPADSPAGLISTASNHHTPRCEYSLRSPASHSIAWFYVSAHPSLSP